MPFGLNLSAGFGKSQRLLSSRQYSAVLRKGQRYHDPLFALIVLANNQSTARLGITVSKKVSKRAVDRNRIKRLVREYFRTHQQTLANQDIVVIARPAAAKAENRALTRAIAKVMSKAKGNQTRQNDAI